MILLNASSLSPYSKEVHERIQYFHSTRDLALERGAVRRIVRSLAFLLQFLESVLLIFANFVFAFGVLVGVCPSLYVAVVVTFFIFLLSSICLCADVFICRPLSVDLTLDRNELGSLEYTKRFLGIPGLAPYVWLSHSFW
eukprot:gnl/TRDRNA2_/TRDRNA2_87372_c0_seq2.p1 gnl/TRDRNA2_/TRDRNA2_87372_c0~~gnl/TRDRNA2_/TRDRNA2_87372_c0_seq2.p1  ORF type:complete len:140 (+),score=1.46 gnl/TRDRNA2_/TRDRNA2_87372_c0_seq2:90-509(+)